jgi:hypothetical protein
VSKDYHPQIHELKVIPKYYAFLREGLKQFELRKDDRKFMVDDLLILREWTESDKHYTGYTICAVVTCVVRGEWLAPGYVALGIRVLQYSWREIARATIQRALQEAESQGLDAEAKKKYVNSRYPFGEHAYHPYKIWLSEMKATFNPNKPGRSDLAKLAEWNKLAQEST